MNDDKMRQCFCDALGLRLDQVTDTLEYNSVPEWDSVGHMALVAALEGAFDLMMDTDDILALSTVARAREILGRYGIVFNAA